MLNAPRDDARGAARGKPVATRRRWRQAGATVKATGSKAPLRKAFPSGFFPVPAPTAAENKTAISMRSPSPRTFRRPRCVCAQRHANAISRVRRATDMPSRVKADDRETEGKRAETRHRALRPRDPKLEIALGCCANVFSERIGSAESTRVRCAPQQVRGAVSLPGASREIERKTKCYLKPRPTERKWRHSGRSRISRFASRHDADDLDGLAG